MNSKSAMTGYALVLLVYAGWRSFDYMSNSLQDVSASTALLVSVVFLFASEIGLLVWLYVASPRASTDTQETTARMMIGINFLGSMVLGLADLLRHNTLYSVDLQVLDPVLLLSPWVLIACNVGGHIVYHLSDAEELTRRAERQLVHEENKLEIEARLKAVSDLQKNRAALAEKLAPVYVKDLTDKVTGRTMQRFTRKANQLTKAQAIADPVLIGGNGQGPKGTR